MEEEGVREMFGEELKRKREGKLHLFICKSSNI